MRPVRNAHKHGKDPQLLLHKSDTNEVNELLSWSSRPALFSSPLYLFLTLSSQLELGRPWCLAVPLGAASLTQFLPTHLFTITTVDYLLGKRQAETFTSCQIITSLVLLIRVSTWSWVPCKLRDSLYVYLFQKTDQKIKAGHSFLLSHLENPFQLTQGSGRPPTN